MDLLQLLLAAAFFSIGGLLMKLSNGASRPAYTVAFLTLFCFGAVLQALAMRRADLGVAYIAVLGLEAVLTLLFSVLVLRESYGIGRISAVALIIAGVALLRRA